MNNKRDEARLKSWESGEYVTVNNVRETACDTAHWGWVRGFNEGYAAASIDRVQVVDDFQARLLERFTAMADKQWTFEIDSRAEAKQMLRAAIALEMDAVIEAMEVKNAKQK